MTFRNPLTSLRADQIEPGTLSAEVVARTLADGAVDRGDVLVAGVIGADALAANAIDGKVITGATLRTAAPPAKRVTISSTTSGRVDFHTGDPDENTGGRIESGIDLDALSTDLDRPYLEVLTPGLGAGTPGGMRLYGPTRDGFALQEVHVDGLTVLPNARISSLVVLAAIVLSGAAWAAPALLSSWVNYGLTWPGAGYRKSAAGTVHLRGLIKSGTVPTTGGVALFQLPVGFRPSGSLMFPVMNNGALGRIDVQADGFVVAQPPTASNTWLSLAGISFHAEA